MNNLTYDEQEKADKVYVGSRIAGSLVSHMTLATITGGLSLLATVPSSLIAAAARNGLTLIDTNPLEAPKFANMDPVYDKINEDKKIIQTVGRRGAIDGALQTAGRPLTYMALAGGFAADMAGYGLKSAQAGITALNPLDSAEHREAKVTAAIEGKRKYDMQWTNTIRDVAKGSLTDGYGTISPSDGKHFYELTDQVWKIERHSMRRNHYEAAELDPDRYISPKADTGAVYMRTKLITSTAAHTLAAVFTGGVSLLATLPGSIGAYFGRNNFDGIDVGNKPDLNYLDNVDQIREGLEESATPNSSAIHKGFINAIAQTYGRPITYAAMGVAATADMAGMFAKAVVSGAHKVNFLDPDRHEKAEQAMERERVMQWTNTVRHIAWKAGFIAPDDGTSARSEWGNTPQTEIIEDNSLWTEPEKRKAPTPGPSGMGM